MFHPVDHSSSLLENRRNVVWNYILTLSQTSPGFLRVCSTSLLKTLMEKEKLLVTSNFAFSISVFYLFGQLSAIFITIYNCRLQTVSVWKSLKFVVWKRVKARV